MGNPSETAVQNPSPSTSSTRRDATKDMETPGSAGGYSGVYNIDEHTGFMSSRPRARLPAPWDLWEDVLDAARRAQLQVGDKIGLTQDEAAASSEWRDTVRQMAVLSAVELDGSNIQLHFAHVVLAYILHFYVHTLPPSSPISIPPSISIPLLSISQRLDVPPVITYADNALYNWTTDSKASSLSPSPNHEGSDDTPTLATVRSLTTFTNLIDEEEFYLGSVRIELRGVEALDYMSRTIEEIRDVSNDNASTSASTTAARITGYLQTLASVIDGLRDLLLSIKKSCDPDRYYNQVRVWLRGEDASSTPIRKWIFEGIDAYPELRVPTELSGPSAGQSCLIHALDVFFGVDHEGGGERRQSLMTRMQEYMPSEHRQFLAQLRESAPSVRRFILDAPNNEELLKAFNRAVSALKGFRDAHMIIVTLFVLGPARRAAALQAQSLDAEEQAATKGVAGEVVKGTGGTDLVKFLKETRTRTTEALIRSD